MTYKQIGAEFFYGCLQAVLCVELLICKLIRDSFGWVSKKFEFLCQDGMKQIARLRDEPSGISRPSAFWPRQATVVRSWDKLASATAGTLPRTDATSTFRPPAPRGSAA